MKTLRLPLLSLECSGSKRPSATELRALLGVKGNVRLPLQTPVFERKSSRFVIYLCLRHRDGRPVPVKNFFRLVERHGNTEYELDRGKAGVLVGFACEPGHGYFFGEGKKMGKYRFLIPFDGVDWSQWPEIIKQ